MVKLNRMVLTQGFGFILLPVIAVALTKFYGDSPEETEKKLVRGCREGREGEEGLAVIMSVACVWSVSYSEAPVDLS